MYDVELVQVCDSANEMLEVPACLLFIQFGVPHDVVEEFPVFDVLHDEEKVLGGFDYLVELDDAWVPDQFQDVDLSRNPLYVSDVDDLLLYQDLDGDFLARESVRAEFDLAESALPDGPAQNVVADPLLFRVILSHLSYNYEIIDSDNKVKKLTNKSHPTLLME